MKIYAYILGMTLSLITVIGCKNENVANRNIKENKNTLTYKIEFPETVYTHKKYKGKIYFYNSMLDTIAQPRRDTLNFRFIIYKPFQPYIYGDEYGRVFKDSVLLEKNSIDIEFEFEKPGIYNIGGFARDAIRMNYYTNGTRDSARFIEHEIILSRKVIVKDSI